MVPCAYGGTDVGATMDRSVVPHFSGRERRLGAQRMRS